MRLAKLAVASVSPTVGAVRSNVSRLIAVANEMAAANVTIGAFPEQAVGGYPPEDLVQWPGFLVGQRARARALREGNRRARRRSSCSASRSRSADRSSTPPPSCIAAASPASCRKKSCPTYNVFYEGRTFSRGGPGLALDAGGVPLGDYRFAFDFGDVAVEVCEDAWSPDGPMRRRCYSGSEIVVNVSTLAVSHGHRFDAARNARDARRRQPGACCSTPTRSAARTGLIYDGGGFIFQNGRLVFEAPRFAEGWWSSVVDLDRTRRLRMENTTWRTDCEAFRLRARDWCR